MKQRRLRTVTLQELIEVIVNYKYIICQQKINLM